DARRPTTLQIARADVIADGVTEHAGKRVFQVNLVSTDDRHQFNFVIELLSQRWKADRVIGANQRAISLEKGDWLGRRTQSKLHQMLGVISASHDHPVDGFYRRQQAHFGKGERWPGESQRTDAASGSHAGRPIFEIAGNW